MKLDGGKSESIRQKQAEYVLPLFSCAAMSLPSFPRPIHAALQSTLSPKLMHFARCDLDHAILEIMFGRCHANASQHSPVGLSVIAVLLRPDANATKQGTKQREEQACHELSVVYITRGLFPRWKPVCAARNILASRETQYIALWFPELNSGDPSFKCVDNSTEPRPHTSYPTATVEKRAILWSSPCPSPTSLLRTA